MFKNKLFKTVFGMEFKDDSLAAVCLRNDLSGINLLSSATFPLKDDDNTIAEIKKFIEKYRANTGKVFVTIPNKWAIIKFTEIPLPKGKGSISQLIHYEIERHIPFKIDDIFYDFVVVDKKDVTCRVAIVAVQKEKVEHVKKFFERLPLQVEGINISHFAMLSAIELSGIKVGGWQELFGIAKKSNIFGRKGEIGISLFLNKDESVLSVMKNNSCVYLRTFAFDSSKSVDIISEEFFSVVKETLSGLSLQKMDRLILSGDIPFLSDLSDALMVKLGVKTAIVNPLSRFLPLDKAADMQWLTPSVGACLSGLGIGTLRVNFLPHKTEEESKKIAFLTTKISALLILFLGISILVGEVVNEKRFLARLGEALKKNESDVKMVEELSANLKTFEEQKGFLLNIKKNDITMNMLLELSNIIPLDAWITNLSYKESEDKAHKTLNRELVISGYAVASSKLISILEDSPLFEKVEFVGPITKTKDKEGFKIKAVVIGKK